VPVFWHKPLGLEAEWIRVVVGVVVEGVHGDKDHLVAGERNVTQSVTINRQASNAGGHRGILSKRFLDSGLKERDAADYRVEVFVGIWIFSLQ